MTEREELQMLRAFVEKQKEKLAAKDRIIEKQNIQIENMIQALLHARKKLYGASTEVTKQVDGRKRKIASTLTFLGGCFAATDI